MNGTGQDTPEHQIDGLKQAHAELVSMHFDMFKTQCGAFWDMRNGYCMPLSLEHLRAVNHMLDPAQPGGDLRRRRFMDSVTFGTQWDTQVGDTPQNAGNAPQPSEWLHKVAQIYCSALPVAYNKAFPPSDWTHFATAVLQAAYEATFAAAAVLSRERGNDRVKVFLTRVGGGELHARGAWLQLLLDFCRLCCDSAALAPYFEVTRLLFAGVFGNDAGWIQAAITAAYGHFSAYPIDVKMMNFVRGRDYCDTGAAQPAQPAVHPAAVAPHFSGGSAAGVHPAAGFPAAPTHAAVPSGCAPASAAELGRQAWSQLELHLGTLWEGAYKTAWNSGAVDAGVFAEIRQLTQNGTLSHGQVAAWINRRKEPSGYTLLHQIAWHGNYERHKQVCGEFVSFTFFIDAVLGVCGHGRRQGAAKQQRRDSQNSE